MVTGQYFWSCDWGSSSFRLYLVEAESCKIISSFSSSEGVTKLAKLESQISISERCHNYLSQTVKKLTLESGLSGAFPCIISGMTSSAHGWRPLDYAQVPFSLSGATLKYEALDTTIEQVDKLYFLSGVQTESDVMRGEETELIGILQQESYRAFTKNCLLIMPGTHSKHIIIEDNKMIDFQTFMTGEVFELLSQHSVLRNNIEQSKQLSPAFSDGVKRSLNSKILNTLFSVRTNDLFAKYNKQENFDFLSGLLIGTELHACSDHTGEILLYANGKMLQLYEKASELLSLKLEVVESDKIASIYGHKAFLNNLAKQSEL